MQTFYKVTYTIGMVMEQWFEYCCRANKQKRYLTNKTTNHNEQKQVNFVTTPGNCVKIVGGNNTNFTENLIMLKSSKYSLRNDKLYEILTRSTFI